MLNRSVKFGWLVKRMPQKWTRTQIIAEKAKQHQIKIQKPNKQKAHASEKGKPLSEIADVIRLYFSGARNRLKSAKHHLNGYYAYYKRSSQWTKKSWTIVFWKLTCWIKNEYCLNRFYNKQTAFIDRGRRFGYINRRKAEAERQKE